MSKNLINKLEKKIIKEAVKYEGMPIALSGGIDSGLLAALIKPRYAISVEIPGDAKYNEINYAKEVVEHLGLKHIIVKLDETKLDEDMATAVKAIGRPIPHFNIFPMFQMYKKLAEMGERTLVLGDGPDETMFGYARDLILTYLYRIYEYEAFEYYHPLIDKILPPFKEAMEKVFDREIPKPMSINEANMKIMRKDMDDMSDGIAKHFNIKNHRPYQDNEELDKFMLDLPLELKIRNSEYGKYALRKIAEKYLPYKIVWRKKKVGGPVYPINVKKGWLDDGEFNKTKYIQWQKEILSQ